MAGKKVGMKCPRCGKQYQLGYNGVSGVCDSCAGIQRDADGNAWHSWENQQTYIPIGGGEEFIVKRQDAFRKGG
jgi:hypothetical protein